MFLICLGNAFPLVAAASIWHDDACQRACCKGKPRHSAKDCSDAICHLKPALKAVPKEHLCGIKETAEKRIAEQKNHIYLLANLINVPIYDASAETGSHETGDVPYLNTKFADFECQTTAFSIGSAGSGCGQKPRPSANEGAPLTSFADQPRPPSPLQIKFYQRQALIARRSPARQLPTRAPPLFLS